MTKVPILLLALLAIATCLQCNATIGNFLSPYSLGKQDEMFDALAILCKQAKIDTTVYGMGKTNYTIYNASLQCIYNDGRQTSEIQSRDRLFISGGKIEFLLNFNYSISKIGPDQTGYGFASVMSDSVNFTKEVTVNLYGYPVWVIPNDTLPNPITITQPFSLKRYDPKNLTEIDIDAINQALSKAISSITPSTVKQQILDRINDNLTAILNQTLREEKLFNNETNYTYTHFVRGPQTINLLNRMYNYNMTKEEGWEIRYLSYIKGDSTTDCLNDVNDPYDFQYYGGIQTIQTFDLYKKILKFNLRNKWLDTVLDSTWETNAFQFYAGDLYEVIPAIVDKNVPPRTKIAGECQALDDGFLSLSRNSFDTIKLNINYTCTMRSADTARTLYMNFTVDATFIVQIILHEEEMEFVITSARGMPFFYQTGEYVVTKLDQAHFKVDQAMKSLVGYRVFGTGFPSWPRDLPEVEVHDGFVLLYDSSHVPHNVNRDRRLKVE